MFDYPAPTFDARDQELLDQRLAHWNKRQGPRVGDWCVWPGGEVGRFTHDWGDALQTTCKPGPERFMNFGLGSFYMTKDGYLSYSGALDPGIALDRLVDTGETRDGDVWFFHHEHARANNGVHVKIPCRVYRIAD